MNNQHSPANEIAHTCSVLNVFATIMLCLYLFRTGALQNVLFCFLFLRPMYRI